MKNKKGSSFGMIISMTLFLSFLVILYAYFSPQIKIRNDGQTYLNEIVNNLKNSMESNISVISIKLKEVPTRCFEIKSPSNILGNVSVRNSKNKLVRSDYSPPNLEIEGRIDKFYKIYSSKYLNKENSSLHSCHHLILSNNYSIGLVKTEKIISEKKILSLNKSFHENYAELKSNLLIPPNYNFDFIFEGSKTINASLKKESLNVYAINEKVIYINESGYILLGDLKVELW